MIPALTRMKDYAGAVDQYIELINNFPEDAGLVTEAALYSLRYQRQQQLVDYYAKTVTQSPRDYRWPMVLAEIDTSLEQYPAAIESYTKAITIRPDRVDLHQARANLEERLMRFDDAAADYQRIYELAFKDPKWMEKVAEVRARQGRATMRSPRSKSRWSRERRRRRTKYFEVARRLESWGMLSQARTFAEQGVAAAGPELLATLSAAIRRQALRPHHDSSAPAGEGLCHAAECTQRCIGNVAGYQGADRQGRHSGDSPTENGEKGPRKTASEPRVMECVPL